MSTLASFPESLHATAAHRPGATIIVPVYNEEPGVLENFGRLRSYVEERLSGHFDVEILFVNDGSSDRSGQILNQIERTHSRVRVVHHPFNRGLNEAIKTGFANVHTEYAVTIDSDLSYAPEHIGRLLDTLIEKNADLVLASPYMEGGRVTNVPLDRLILSRWANRFLSLISPKKLSTFTGMVRAYRMPFVRGIDLKAGSMDINPEIIYKTMLLRGRIEEIPAHLDWSGLATKGPKKRRRSFGMQWNTLAILFSGFLFRPFLFFFLPGAFLTGVALLMGIYLVIHTGVHYQDLPVAFGSFYHKLEAAVDSVYRHHGYFFAFTATLLIVSVQLLTLGIMSLQSKRYFEEIFHLGTSIYRKQSGLDTEAQAIRHHLPDDPA